MTAPTFPGGKLYPVHHFAIAGVVWRVETNGQALTMRVVHDAHPSGPANVRLFDVAAHLAAAAPQGYAVSLPELREFLGPAIPDKTVKCANCETDGCDWCDGTSEVTESAPLRLVRVEGVKLNANLLAAALDVAVAEGQCRLKRANSDTLYVIGDRWRVAVMAMAVRDRARVFKPARAA